MTDIMTMIDDALDADEPFWIAALLERLETTPALDDFIASTLKSNTWSRIASGDLHQQRIDTIRMACRFLGPKQLDLFKKSYLANLPIRQIAEDRSRGNHDTKQAIGKMAAALSAQLHSPPKILSWQKFIPEASKQRQEILALPPERQQQALLDHILDTAEKTLKLDHLIVVRKWGVDNIPRQKLAANLNRTPEKLEDLLDSAGKAVAKHLRHPTLSFPDRAVLEQVTLEDGRTTLLIDRESYQKILALPKDKRLSFYERQQQNVLAAAKEHLTVEQQRTFELHFLQNLPLNSVAATLSKSPSTVSESWLGLTKKLYLHLPKLKPRLSSPPQNLSSASEAESDPDAKRQALQQRGIAAEMAGQADQSTISQDMHIRLLASSKRLSMAAIKKEMTALEKKLAGFVLNAADIKTKKQQKTLFYEIGKSAGLFCHSSAQQEAYLALAAKAMQQGQLKSLCNGFLVTAKEIAEPVMGKWRDNRELPHIFQETIAAVYCRIGDDALRDNLSKPVYTQLKKITIPEK